MAVVMLYGIHEWTMWVGTLVFIMFIVWDIWKAYSRGAFWIPGKALVLTGLTIQLLGLLEVRPSPSPHQKECEDNYDAQAQTCSNEYWNYFIDTELPMSFARCTVCVLMAYLLPGMASPRSGQAWTNTFALFLSLSTHISKEVYLDDWFRKTLTKHERSSGDNPISMTITPISLLFLVLMIGLIVLLGLAVVAGMFISRNMSLRIPLILSQSIVESEDRSWSTMRREMLKCWIVARLCQPEYVLARSGFSAGTLGMVTFAIAITALEFLVLRSIQEGILKSKINSPPIIQSIFLLIGWIVIFYRWLKVVVYFPRFTPSMRNLWGLFGGIVRWYNQVNDRIVMVLVISYTKWPVAADEESLLRVILLRVIPLGALILALLPALVVLVILIIGAGIVILGSAALAILFITYFWCVSALVSKVFKMVSKLGKKMLKPMSNDEQLSTYLPDPERIVMPGEDPLTLWKANKKYFCGNKLQLDRGYKEGQSCKELIEIVNNSLATNNLRSFVNRLQPLKSVEMLFPSVKEPLWRVTAICLLKIILEVIPLASHEDGDEDMDFHLKLDRAIKAYDQAQNLLDFADCPQNVDETWNIFGNCNGQSLAVRHVSDKQTKIIEKRHKHLAKERLARGAHHTITTEGAKQCIQKLYHDAEASLKKEYLLEEISVDKMAYGIYSDWKSAGLSYGMYKVCKIIRELDSQNDVKRLVCELIGFLGDVIASCLSESQDLVLKSCQEWAAQFEEGKISSSMSIAGKLGGVMDAAKSIQGNISTRARESTSLD